MKKILLLLSLILLTGCSKNLKVSQQVNIEKPVGHKITKQGDYSLDCKTHYYTTAVIGGELIEESYIKISEGNEREALYVNGESATFFGSDYDVIQDDSAYLVIIRQYSVSGLTEVVSINKETGIGFDTKTLTLGLSGAPTSDTYIVSCIEL